MVIFDIDGIQKIDNKTNILKYSPVLPLAAKKDLFALAALIGLELLPFLMFLNTRSMCCSQRAWASRGGCRSGCTSVSKRACQGRSSVVLTGVLREIPYREGRAENGAKGYPHGDDRDDQST